MCLPILPGIILTLLTTIQFKQRSTLELMEQIGLKSHIIRQELAHLERLGYDITNRTAEQDTTLAFKYPTQHEQVLGKDNKDMLEVLLGQANKHWLQKRDGLALSPLLAAKRILLNEQERASVNSANRLDSLNNLILKAQIIQSALAGILIVIAGIIIWLCIKVLRQSKILAIVKTQRDNLQTAHKKSQAFSLETATAKLETGE